LLELLGERKAENLRLQGLSLEPQASLGSVGWYANQSRDLKYYHAGGSLIRREAEGRMLVFDTTKQREYCPS
jgi:hypothetical protein